MIQFLRSKWMAAIAGTLAFAMTTWFCLQPTTQFEYAVSTLRAMHNALNPPTPEVGPSWAFHNPEMSQLVAELRDEREAVRVRVAQLDELEARLRAERQEIYSVTQAVHQLRADLEMVVTRISAEEAVNLKKLAKVYATMSPEGAARILKEMEDVQVVKILALMRESESAPILESLGQASQVDARRTAIISNRLRLTLSAAKKPATP